jgi:hypothetical protein
MFLEFRHSVPHAILTVVLPYRRWSWVVVIPSLVPSWQWFGLRVDRPGVSSLSSSWFWCFFSSGLSVPSSRIFVPGGKWSDWISAEKHMTTDSVRTETLHPGHLPVESLQTLKYKQNLKHVVLLLWTVVWTYRRWAGTIFFTPAGRRVDVAASPLKTIKLQTL